ncbi:hypothetical protein F5B22DRAFT_199002 [Xylaria bambusicola]|uniref:uncharacterized protein n=1 Tax=Xylaria bambusicola TaxID=326684 RepID=UPI0020089E96|nr:uncharacterized protein F5B22DRAFT_199002 [Xylaria bambusicola]KAI0515333.1 hypothetical protein F5B22DRAFT_199002 [Xylaria bambusicola]
MQGDIFQLESLTSPATVLKPQPKPAMARPRPTNNPQVAIYNEDDLSHLLYMSSHPHHHHHHHAHEQRPFTHPADIGTVLINSVDDMEATTPALSDCESCCGSEGSGMYIESPVTPPLTGLEEVDELALEAYRRKGRRNALSTDSLESLGFPIFLGRQDEEVEEWPVKSQSAPQKLSQNVAFPAVKLPEVPASQHVNAIDGTMMSWWPESLDTMEHEWAVEKTQWQLQLEKEKLEELEREGGIATTKTYKAQYDAVPVSDIEGPLMNWWPMPIYDWSERFYE